MQGKMETNSSDIKADRYFYNKIFSTLSAKNSLTIHTPLSLNLFGLAHAQHLTINSILGFNALGIYAAQNMNVNTLASINAGLFLPKFSTFAEMCSWHNIRGLGESLFIRYVPIYGVMYATYKSMQGIYHQGKAFYDETGSLRKQKNVGASDTIAFICLIKNMFSSVRQTFNLGKQSYSLLSDSPKSNNSQTLEASSDAATQPSDSLAADNVQNLESPFDAARAKDVAQEVISAVASHYSPSVSTNSIIDCNYWSSNGCQ